MIPSRTLLTGSLLALLALPAFAGDPCQDTAKLQKREAIVSAVADYKAALAVCANLTDPDAQQECQSEAKSDFADAKQLCKDQYKARLDLCGKLGGGAYDPVIDPSAFSTMIDNPFMPMPVGAQWTYETPTDDGLETDVVTVTPDTRVIMGVTCVAVQDTVSVDGEVTEDTTDWFAQDAAGNVWYFGELSFSLEGGYIADLEGSWVGGVDGAKPGIVMPAVPPNW